MSAYPVDLPPPLCGRFDCHEPATHEIRPQYGRPYLRCAPHAAISLEVEQKFDNRQTRGATMNELTGRTPDGQ